MDTLWNVRFKQQDPLTKVKVTQVNMGTEENPKSIFISKTITSTEKEGLITLI